uniref:BREX-1 system adenine-specific DNA-methyltransferase PglX n=1 Tax=Desulfobacula sp. TaxID=2593537 RepID=UPI00261AF5D4
MAFDQTTRNRLQNFVTDARTLLVIEFTRQLQNDYGMDPNTGTISSIEELTHLNDTQIQTARLLRDTKEHYQAANPSSDGKQILDRIVREQAFTILNRLCALRMAETRGILVESIGKAHNSEGFQLYKHIAGISLGDIGDTYQTYLFSLFDEFAYDLAVLFDRYSNMGRLFPKGTVLLNLLDKINAQDLEPLWAEDETIGWIYQYFNSIEERRQMRAESQAPRNSRELAVRNQFFTPRYVVEFLTDNTLGRIWYEMTKGNTQLKTQCRYLVQHPHEIILKNGETAPEPETSATDLSQEELLNQVVYIEHRPIKDPREILMLDPACGSMHFGLYAFDLFENIYQETWDLQSSDQWEGSTDKNGELLIDLYPSKEELLRDIPKLIIENNIHGIDIDPRAVQIAGLSLWLRAQRSWKEQSIKPEERSRIVKSNVVCAEPMPGDKALLKSFSKGLKPAVLGQLLEIIFEKMELAGEAGSLLKIEREIETTLEEAREAFNKELLLRNTETGHLPGMEPKEKQPSLFDFADLPSKTQFWETAEDRILTALYEYAEHAEESDGGKLRLFAQDAAKGFAFIDICRKQYDVVLMNPPFGLGSKKAAKYLDIHYKNSGSSEVCASFYSRAIEALNENGFFGAISSRTFYYLHSLSNWRCVEGFGKSTLCYWIDLGQGILDGAMNETAAYIVKKGRIEKHLSRFGLYHRIVNKETAIKEFVGCGDNVFFRFLSDFEILSDKPLCYWVSNSFVQNLKKMVPFGDEIADVQMGLAPRDEFRFSRLWWEINLVDVGQNLKWVPYAKGGELSPYYSDIELLLNSKDDMVEIKAALNHKYKYLKGNLSWILHPENSYFEQGLTFGQRTSFLRACSLPAGGFFSVAGKAIFGKIISNEALLQAINTPTVQYLTYLRRERMDLDPQFQEGDVARMPWPTIPEDGIKLFEELSLESTNGVQSISSYDEADHLFVTYSDEKQVVIVKENTEQRIKKNERIADKYLSKLLSLDKVDQDFIKNEILPNPSFRKNSQKLLFLLIFYGTTKKYYNKISRLQVRLSLLVNVV